MKKKVYFRILKLFGFSSSYRSVEKKVVTDMVTDTVTYVNTNKSLTSVSTDTNLNANLISMILDMKELQIIVNEQGKNDDMQKRP